MPSSNPSRSRLPSSESLSKYPAHFDKQSALYKQHFAINASDIRFNNHQFLPDIKLSRTYAYRLIINVFKKCKVFNDCDAQQGLLRDCLSMLVKLPVYRKYTHGEDDKHYFECCLKSGRMHDELRRISKTKNSMLTLSPRLFSSTTLTATAARNQENSAMMAHSDETTYHPH